MREKNFSNKFYLPFHPLSENHPKFWRKNVGQEKAPVCNISTFLCTGTGLPGPRWHFEGSSWRRLQRKLFGGREPRQLGQSDRVLALLSWIRRRPRQHLEISLSLLQVTSFALERNSIWMSLKCFEFMLSQEWRRCVPHPVHRLAHLHGTPGLPLRDGSWPVQQRGTNCSLENVPAFPR